MAITISLIFYINFKIIRLIKSTKKVVTEKTFHLQVMFYRAVLVKSIFMLVFMGSPVIFMLLSAAAIINSNYGESISIAFLNMHASVSYILLIALIRPYREFIYNVVRKFIPGFRTGATQTKVTIIQVLPKSSGI